MTRIFSMFLHSEALSFNQGFGLVNFLRLLILLPSQVIKTTLVRTCNIVEKGNDCILQERLNGSEIESLWQWETAPGLNEEFTRLKRSGCWGRRQGTGRFSSLLSEDYSSLRWTETAVMADFAAVSSLSSASVVICMIWFSLHNGSLMLFFLIRSIGVHCFDACSIHTFWIKRVGLWLSFLLRSNVLHPKLRVFHMNDQCWVNYQ